MTFKRPLVTVIIPCYNEADGIRKVISDFHKSELNKAIFEFDILVVDNNSNDGTAELAAKAGARVIREHQQGKGFAIRTGFVNIHPDADYVVMLDGDDTYRPEEALRLLEPLHHNFCDVIVGSRLSGKISGGSMTRLNRVGNWSFTFMTRYYYHSNVTDVLSGYFAWKSKVVRNLAPHLTSHGFAIEMEMLTKMAKMGYEVYSVPISYYDRAGRTNLRPFKDGFRILKMFLRNTFWRLPDQDERKDERIEIKA